MYRKIKYLEKIFVQNNGSKNFLCFDTKKNKTNQKFNLRFYYQLVINYFQFVQRLFVFHAAEDIRNVLCTKLEETSIKLVLKLVLKTRKQNRKENEKNTAR